MRCKITLLLIVTLVYECHSGLIKDILSNHYKRSSVNKEPGTVILVVKEDQLGYGGKPGYGGQGQHHGNEQGQGGHYEGHQPEYGGYGPHKPGYGDHHNHGGHGQQNWPGHGGHRPSYGGHRPSYGGHRPGYGHHSLESHSITSEESSEEFYGYRPGFGGRPPYQGGENFNQHGPYGNNKPHFGNKNPNDGSFQGYKPSFNQVKPVYETSSGQPSIEGPPIQPPNINQAGNKPYQGGNIPNLGGNKPNLNQPNPEGDPLLVPLDPAAEYNQNGANKRETFDQPKPAEDEEYGIDIRYGDK